MKKINRAGYTIIELMIVLAVTAVTAVSAFMMVQGQQSKNEFSQSVRDFETRLTDVANDVAKGYFPDIGGNRRCRAPSGGPVSFAGGATVSQGSSKDCVFAGKAIRFYPSGANQNTASVYTIVSRRLTRDDKPVTSMSSLETGDLAIVPGLEERVPLKFKLRISSIQYNGNTGNDGVAFLTGFANKPTSSSQLSGSPDTNLYWIAKSTIATCAGSISTALRRPECYVEPDPAVSGEGVELCLLSGSGRTALLRLGREGRQLTTTTEMDVAC